MYQCLPVGWIYLPSGNLYKRLQRNMVNFPFNSNVNLWVKIHLIYEPMLSRILIKLRSYLLFCDMQSSCFSIFEYDHAQLFKNINAKKFCKFFNTIQGKLFCCKKEILIEPHVWSIKMIKLGNYFFLEIDYSINFVRINNSWGNK